MRDKQLPKRPAILVACKDVSYAGALAAFLQNERYDIERCADAAGVLRLAGKHAFDVIVLDLALSDESDVKLVSFVQQRSPATQLILLFEITRFEQALEAIRQGAFFYLPISSPPSDVALVVDKAVRTLTRQATLDQYERNIFEEFIGSSPAMQRVVEVITKVAPTDSTVLLLGESGTGKEVLANALHRLSRRRDMPFIAINCAALPEALLESEMFGHAKGAFTGAERDKRGLFEEADGGTIFLDEIGDMALVTQAKLLRVLQNGEIRPVGTSLSRRVNVRVIAATNRDLTEAVRNNDFREDLYFRLNVVTIRIPPLRERIDALPSLVNHFLAEFNRSYGKRIRSIDDHAWSLLHSYDFPGNVRELESIIAHSVILADEDVIRARDLPDQVVRGSTPRLALPHFSDQAIPTLAEVEAQHIHFAMDRLDRNQTQVAQQLGISRSTLWRKLREYNIEK
jgi:DNA-binding NtrC family response regulator